MADKAPSLSAARPAFRRPPPMPYFSNDDIAQIATPPGPGGTGVLRLSGPNAFAILRRVADSFAPGWEGRPEKGVHACRMLLPLSVHDGTRRSPGLHPCRARVFLMPGPASYTREDVAEIHLPGAGVVLAAGLARLAAEGARPAERGEFTFRAFRNGRLGLAQAEAVEEIIRASDEAERKAALARLGDEADGRVALWREQALGIAARLEAALDFPDEEPGADALPDMAALAAALENEGVALADNRLMPGSGLPHAAFVGLANAGKSSLMNALFGDDRHLTSARPATTRDRLVRLAEWNNAVFELSDNPGHDPEGENGADGADGADDRRLVACRAMAGLGGEDLACWVVDSSRPAGPAEEAFCRRLRGRVFIIMNKADLPAATTPDEAAGLARRAGLDVAGVALVSAVRGDGLAELRRRLAEAVRRLGPHSRWNSRERLELAAALDGLRAAADELSGAGRLELASEEMRRCAEAFSRALGEGYAEETLVRIFSGFCIGK